MADVNITVVQSDAISVAVASSDAVAVAVGNDSVNAQMASQETIVVKAEEQTINVSMTIGNKDIHKVEKLTSVGGETTFTLAENVRPDSLWMLKNGIPQEVDVEFSLSGKVVTFSALDAGEKVEFRYVKA